MMAKSKDKRIRKSNYKVAREENCQRPLNVLAVAYILITDTPDADPLK